VLAPALLRLAGKAAVLLVVSVLAGLLMPDADRNRLLCDAGGTPEEFLTLCAVHGAVSWYG
jgi:hypothetical protein